MGTKRTDFNNEYVVNLIGENVQTVLPIVFPALNRIAQAHWNRCVSHKS